MEVKLIIAIKANPTESIIGIKEDIAMRLADVVDIKRIDIAVVDTVKGVEEV